MANPEMSQDEFNQRFEEIVNHEFTIEQAATEKEKLYMVEVEETFKEFMDWLAMTDNANIKLIPFNDGTRHGNQPLKSADISGVCYRLASSDEIHVNKEECLNLFEVPSSTSELDNSKQYIAQLFDSKKDQAENNPFAELIISHNDLGEIVFMQSGNRIGWKNMLESTLDYYSEERISEG